MNLRPNSFLLPIFLVAAASADAAIDRRVLSGSHDSACSAIRLQGKAAFSRFIIRFDGRRYASFQTFYSDPKCEISVLQTNSQGTWEMAYENVLSLRLTRMQIRPLDPRMADEFTRARKCGKPWEYGVANEVLGTDCARIRRADYFADPSPSGKSLILHECEGLPRIGPGCTRYGMARTASLPSPKPPKSRGSRARIIHPQL